MACRAAIFRSEKLSERTRERKRAAKIVHNHFEGTAEGCYNSEVPHGPSASAVLLRGIPPSESAQCTAKSAVSRCSDRHVRTEWHEGSGQVAQVVERSPEKAGVGGSTPSLATIFNPLTSPHNYNHVPKRSNKLGGSPGFVSKFFKRSTARGATDSQN